MEKHTFDSLSFSFGVIYAVVGLLFLLPATPVDLIEVMLSTSRWLWPAVILGLGAAIIVPALRSGESTDEPAEAD